MKTAAKLLLVTALASTSVAVMAYPGKGGHGEGHHAKHGEHRGHHGGEVRKMLRGLDLTDEQKAQVKALIKQAHESKGEKPQRDLTQVEAQMAARQALMTSPTFDEAAARALIAERQAKQTERELARLKLQHEIIQLLTDEQKAKLAEKADKRIERFRAHHGQ
ncbi:Spy/CpxP family protein refolding chaperone [Ferrimonas balearica]|uniref:Spy/CpxP family protein refolding chaperone n=1 Tax=Ferrimonas balearica TaxID=44012 RepID=UPI001C9A299C|nr:Spy/CpxP family protein refolding chaperone [Ferrimonas balearica]MBY5994123.1 Spy/CpxP family protein refolding chaperone [Ferrimonas balearica]